MPYCSHCGRANAPTYQGGDHSDRGRLDRHRRAGWDREASPGNELCAATVLGLRANETCRCGLPGCLQTREMSDAE